MKGDLIAAAVGASLALAVVATAEITQDRIDKERSAFARKCNESGRIAQLIDGILQCVSDNQARKDQTA